MIVEYGDVEGAPLSIYDSSTLGPADKVIKPEASLVSEWWGDDGE